MNNISPETVGKIVRNKWNRHQPVVALVGAGVSMRAPASALDWKTLTTRILDSIYQRVQKELNISAPELDDTEKFAQSVWRPEVLYQIFHQYLGQGVFDLMDELDSGDPNINHYFLASGLIIDQISTIITTNFDRYIERTCWSAQRAREDHDDEMAAVCIGTGNSQELLRPRTIVKIHGCIGAKSSAHATISRVSTAFPSEFVDNLHALLGNSILLVMGYSGRDSALMNFLAQQKTLSKVDTLIWCFYSDKEIKNCHPNVANLKSSFGKKWLETICPAEYVLPLCFDGVGLKGMHLPTAITARDLDRTFAESWSTWPFSEGNTLTDIEKRDDLEGFLNTVFEEGRIRLEAPRGFGKILADIDKLKLAKNVVHIAGNAEVVDVDYRYFDKLFCTAISRLKEMSIDYTVSNAWSANQLALSMAELLIFAGHMESAALIADVCLRKTLLEYQDRYPDVEFPMRFFEYSAENRNLLEFEHYRLLYSLSVVANALSGKKIAGNEEVYRFSGALMASPFASDWLENVRWPSFSRVPLASGLACIMNGESDLGVRLVRRSNTVLRLRRINSSDAIEDPAGWRLATYAKVVEELARRGKQTSALQLAKEGIEIACLSGNPVDLAGMILVHSSVDSQALRRNLCSEWARAQFGSIGLDIPSSL